MNFSVFLSLPVYSQHLLVLLFGTFRVIHSNCEKAKTGMTAEALGISVAPSFFHTCVAAGKTAKMEDVERFKVNKQDRNACRVGEPKLGMNSRNFKCSWLGYTNE